MAHDDPFTFARFGNTALASGLDFGMSGFAADPGNHFEDDPRPSTPTPVARVRKDPKPKGQMRAKVDFQLQGSRGLAKSWRDRARDNIAAILLANEIERQGLPARPDQQTRLIKFTGFGASDLANGIFRRPGDEAFRKGWEELGGNLESAVAPGDYASLARCTQYAHFTPEFLVRAIWLGLVRMGFKGGRILEPGIGTGMFPALMPGVLSKVSHVTGIELDPVTARIVRLLQPRARIVCGDFARTDLPDHFDLAIGNPPFSNRTVKSDPAFRSLGFRLHDYFIAKSIHRLKPGGLAAFVTSSGTMDKADARAREHIAGMADLVGAIRLPEGSFRADAGTDVVVDILFFRKRHADEPAGDDSWLDLADVGLEGEGDSVRINRWFVDHPEMVLGRHAITSGSFGETYTCQPTDDDLETILKTAIERLPADIYDGEPSTFELEDEMADAMAERPDDPKVREGSYFIGNATALMHVVDGIAVPVEVRKGRSTDGIFAKHALIIRKLIPIRDAVRLILKLQERDQPWTQAQVSLRIAWSSFVREFGPINFTSVSTSEDPDTGEVREVHRRPNLAPFLDDPDCWLVASIEDYDLETNTAKPGPIFTERVIAPPPAPVITSASDALAVVLNERGHVDPDHIAELLHRDVEDVIGNLGEAIFREPSDGSWQMADAYLSGAVRSKLVTARAAADLDPAFARNVAALERVQPADLRPSDITARLGAPWIPADDVVAFVKQTMDAEISIHHLPELATWTVNARQLEWSAAGTTEWGTHRRHAGQLLSDALNSSVPQIFDTVRDGETERRVLNTVETEAAKEKLAKIKSAFQSWIWSDPDRTDRLARVYNDTFNNIAPRSFNGDHLQLPGASGAFSLYGHQKRGIWRVISAGST